MVYAPRAVADAVAALAEVAGEPGFGHGGQLADGVHALVVEARGGLGADAHQLAHGQGSQEVGLLAGRDNDQAVGFLQVRRDLGHGLAGAEAHGDGEAGLGGNALLNIDGDGNGRAVGGGLGDIEVGLVQGHGLDHLGNVAEDVHHQAGHLAVAVEAGPDDDAIGTLAHGGGHGHRRVHAKPPRLIGRRGHHAPTLRPTTHQHGQAAQLRVIQLLHGGVEGVQVGVDDVANGSESWGSTIRRMQSECRDFTPGRGGKAS